MLVSGRVARNAFAPLILSIHRSVRVLFVFFLTVRLRAMETRPAQEHVLNVFIGIGGVIAFAVFQYGGMVWTNSFLKKHGASPNAVMSAGICARLLDRFSFHCRTSGPRPLDPTTSAVNPRPIVFCRVQYAGNEGPVFRMMLPHILST